MGKKGGKKAKKGKKKESEELKEEMSEVDKEYFQIIITDLQDQVAKWEQKLQVLVYSSEYEPCVEYLPKHAGLNC